MFAYLDNSLLPNKSIFQYNQYITSNCPQNDSLIFITPIQQLKMYWMTIWNSSIENSVLILTPFLTGLFISLKSSFLSSLYILDVSLLLNVELKIFYQPIDYHFAWLTVSFAMWKLFRFMRSYFLILNLSICTISVQFR